MRERLLPTHLRLLLRAFLPNSFPQTRPWRRPEGSWTNGKNSVVVIAGPGTLQRRTLETLSSQRVSANLWVPRLTLPDHCRELRELAVQHLTVTINGFDPEVVARIQPTVNREGRVYLGTRAAEVLIHNQKAGLQAAVESGMVVKVNCVVVPEINGAHVVSTARRVKDLGAHVFNPVPLIPRGLLRDLNRPDDQYMARLRSLCSRFIPVFSHCKQCRADAEGIPGKEAPSGSFPQISTDDHFQPSSETHLWLFRGQWRWAPRGLQTRWPGLATGRFRSLPPQTRHVVPVCKGISTSVRAFPGTGHSRLRGSTDTGNPTAVDKHVTARVAGHATRQNQACDESSRHSLTAALRDASTWIKKGTAAMEEKVLMTFILAKTWW